MQLSVKNSVPQVLGEEENRNINMAMSLAFRVSCMHARGFESQGHSQYGGCLLP